MHWGDLSDFTKYVKGWEDGEQYIVRWRKDSSGPWSYVDAESPGEQLDSKASIGDPDLVIKLPGSAAGGEPYQVQLLRVADKPDCLTDVDADSLPAGCESLGLTTVTTNAGGRGGPQSGSERTNFPRWFSGPRIAPRQQAAGTMYGVDTTSDSLYTVDLTDGGWAVVGSTGFSAPVGLGWNGTTMYGVDTISDETYTVNLTTGAWTSIGDTTVSSPRGMAWHGTTMYGVDTVGDSLYTVNLTSGVWTSVGDTGVDSPTGLEWNGTTMYGTDTGDDELYTVNLTSGAWTSVGDTGVASPAGLGWDGTTMYGVDFSGRDFHTVNLTSGAWTSVGGTGVIQPRGLEWVPPAAVSSDASLSALSLSQGTLSPAFSASTYTYTASVDNSVTSTTVSATTTDNDATVTGTGAQTLNVGANTLTITVTAEDSTTTQDYTVTVTRAAAPAIDSVGLQYDDTAANVEVTLTDPDSTPVYARWKVTSESTYTTLTSQTIDDTNAFTFAITGLTAETGYTVEASLASDYSSATTATFTTRPEGVMYYSGNDSDALFTISRLDGSITRVDSSTSQYALNEGNPNGLCTVDGTVWLAAPTFDRLVPIDLDDGSASLVSGHPSGFGVTEGGPAGCGDLDGTVYLLGNTCDCVYSWNASTGIASQIGSATAFGVSERFPRAMSPHDGELYMVGSGNRSLYRLNTSTGEATRIGSSGGFGQDAHAGGLGTDGETLFMTDRTSRKLFTLNTSNGNATEIGGWDTTKDDAPRGLTFVPASQPAPAQVTGVTAGAASSTSLTVSWNSVTDAEDYHVQWSTTSGSFNTTDAQTVTVTSTTITGLTANTTYYVIVSAGRTGADQGAASDEASATTMRVAPGSVSSLTASNRTTTSMDISWTATVTDTEVTAAFEIEWKTAAEAWDDDTVQTATSSSASYSLSSLIAGTEYNIRVRIGCSSCESSDWTNATASARHPQPAQVTGITATGITSSAIPLSWTADSDADSYTLQWKASTTGTYNFQATPSGNSYTLANLSAFTEYEARVKATHDDADDGDWSDAFTATTLLSTPSNPTATPDHSSIAWDWPDVTDASTYNLQWRVSGGSSTDVTGLTDSAYTLASLSTSTDYEVRVRAVNGSNLSAWSSWVESTTSLGALAQVSGLSVTTGSTTTSLSTSWTAVTNAATYRIQWSTTSGSFSNSNETTTSGVTYNLTGLSSGTTYYVQVRAEASGYTTGAWSSEASGSTTPEVPSGITTTVTVDSIAVNWDAVTGASSYDLRWRLDNNAGSVTDVANITDTTYTISSLASNTAYQVRLRATANSLDSAWSAWLDVTTTSVDVAAAPTGLTLTPGEESIALTWTAPTNTGGETITAYVIEYRTAGATEWIRRDHASVTTSATIPNLTAGIEYEVQVAAVTSNGVGAFTAAAMATAQGPPDTPAPPSLRIDIAADAATLSAGEVYWTEPSDNGGGITSYDLQYRESGTAAWTTLNTTNTTVPLSGFSLHDVYEARVRANNAHGESAYSDIATIRLSPRWLYLVTFNEGDLLRWDQDSAVDVGPLISDAGLPDAADMASIGTDLYMVRLGNLGLYQVDPSTGAAFERRCAVGGGELSLAWGLAGVGNEFYLNGDSNIYTVDPTTCATSLVGTHGIADLRGLAFVDGELYGVENDANWTVHQIDLSDGSATEIGDFGSPAGEAYGLASNGYRLYVAGHGASALHYLSLRDLTTGIVGNRYSDPANYRGAAVLTMLPPGAPSIPTLTAIANGLTVEWAPPEDTGTGSVTAYTVEYRQTGGSTWDEWTHDTLETTATLTGLSLVSYDVRVSASNILSAGDYSATATTTPRAPVAASVSDVSVSDVTKASVTATVALDNPDQQSATVYARYRTTPSGTWSDLTSQTISGDSLTFAISGLSGGTEYEIAASVSSTYASGVQSVTFTTTTLIAPVVTGVTVTSITRTTATATVSLTNPDSASQTVHLRYAEMGTTTYTTDSQAITGTSATFNLSGLAAGTAYVVEGSIGATFPAGQTQQTTFTTTFTAATISTVSTSSITSTSATVTATLANPDSRSVTVYARYRLNSGGGYTGVESVSTSGTSAVFSLAGLTKGTQYRVEVRLDAVLTPTVATFTTLSPRVSAVTVPTGTITRSTVTAELTIVNTDQLLTTYYLRYRTPAATGSWSSTVSVETATATVSGDPYRARSRRHLPVGGFRRQHLSGVEHGQYHLHHVDQ